MNQINYFTIGLMLFTVIEVVLLDKKTHGRLQKYSKNNNKGKSKIDTTYRIIEGTKAQQADYPFIASLLYYDTHMCGGSIISEKVILTAAHCCSDENYVLFKARQLSVAVGSSKWKNAQKFKVSYMIVHEKFDTEEYLHDIALWVLKNKMSSLKNVKPVKLGKSHAKEHTKPVYATVLGWGFTSDNGLMVEHVSEELFMVNIYSMPLRECRKQHDEIGDGQICFTSPDRRGSCFGDSGGPLVTRKHSTLVQIGLVSFGEDCNNTTPEVYTRISTYYSWIKKSLKKITKKNPEK